MFYLGYSGIERYRLGKKLANKKKELAKCLNFESRQPAYEQLMEALKDDKVAMIGLYGMGGCGKTTLAMEAMKIAEAEHLFDEVLFVTVSSTVEVRRIQEKIASSMQYTLPENEERERAQRLCMRLTQENKILMILDDLWEKLHFGAIGIPSSEHHKGCKVLITTRSEAVCTLMDCQRKIPLPNLTDEEAWTLFQKKALISEGTPESDTIKHLGRLISHECKGLPAVIAAVASILKGKAEVIWSVTLNKLRSSKPTNIEKGLRDPYKCLQLSYDNLDTDEAKSLFLLCSVFPEDSDIPIELLTRFAIGMGVVEEVHTYEEARSEVIAAKITLISSCLLLETENERVKMHDLVRDVAHLIAKKENKLIMCELGKDATLEQNSIRYLWCEKIPNNLDCSNLEFLCIQTELEVSDEIFKRMGKLRVLFLVNNEENKLPLSTMSFKTLKDLRCLILCGWELSGLSFVSDMKKLQSLSLYNCSLPSFLELQTNVEVTQLTNLKLLVLHECEMERNIFEVIQKIPQLEELCIIDNSEKWDDYNKNTIEFFKTFSVPQALQWYVIKLGNLYDDDDEFLSPSHQRILSLSHFHISNEAMKDLAKKAKVLLIANIEGGAKNIIPDIFEMEGGGMYELNKLAISDSEEIECLVDTSNHLSEVGTLFSKLLELRIKKMDQLRALWHGCLPANGPFEKLEKLYLRDCPKLTSLFTYVIARSLVQLKILEIYGCDGLKHIIAADDDKAEKSLDEFKIGHPVQSIIFQNLQEVKVSECGELKHVFPVFLSLRRLCISECVLLQHIFPVSFVGDVRNKETSDLKDLLSQNNFEDNSCHQQQKNAQIELPALEELQLDLIPNVVNSGYHVRCPSLGKLSLGTGRYVGFFAIKCSTKARQWDCITIKISNSDSLHPVESAQYLSKQPQGLNLMIMCNIREIELKGFDKVKYLFNLSIASSLMLEILSIWKCPGLEHIIDTGDVYDGKDWDAIFPNLKRLSVYDCGQLEYMLGQYPLDKQHYKEIHIHFPVLEILSLHNLPNFVSICATNSLSMTCPSLKNFECNGCSQLFNDSVSYSAVPVDSREPISTSSKDAKGIQNHFLTLQTLHIRNAEVAEGIFFLNGHQMIGQQVSLRLEDLELRDLPQMTYIWVASKNLFTLQYLKTLIIEGCAKLEVIFPPSVLRCLPKLKYLEIIECNELKQIIEKDVEDKKLSNPQPCFPKLEVLIVQQCHKLKRLISMSASNDLPNLELLFISGAAELEELIECEQGKAKVELPKLKLLVFIQLSTLRQGTELLAVKHRFVSNCPKLDLTSSATLQELRAHFPYSDFESAELIFERCLDLLYGVMESDEVFISGGTCFEKATIDLPIDPKSQRASRSGLPSSQINEESEKEFNGKDPGSEVQPTATPTDTELNERPSSSPLDNSLHKSHLHESVDGQTMSGSYLTDQQKPLGETMNIEEIGKESIQEGPATRAESSGGDILAQDSQVVEQDDKLNEGKTGITPCKKIQIQEVSNLMDKKDGTCIVSNNSIEIPPASADTRKRLGACKHFVDLDDAQIALLVEAIAAYPHLWNVCQKFSERFQAFMLKTLADMLSFLRNESVVSVTPQREEEFHRQCDEVVQLGFERSWVDEMRQRVVARDPQLDHAQARIGELLKRHGHLTRELRNIQNELKSLNDFVDAHTQCFDFL